MNGFLQCVFGYKTISFRKEDVEAFLNFAHSKRLVIWGYRSAEDKIFINIALGDFEYCLAFLDEINIEYEISKTNGLPGFFEKYKKRVGVWIGLSLGILIVVLSSLFVWDVRIIGANTLSENEIVENLQEVGFGVGTFIPSIQTTEISDKYLSQYDNISWMSINPKGNVVYVEIIEQKKVDEAVAQGKYANIVASEDAVIEEIEPSRGTVVTSVGKTVKKGQLLISGISSSARKYTFTYANGRVYGRVNRELEIKIPFEQVQKEYQNPKKTKISVNFFGFTINIFRYCGKMPSKYDTIYRKEQILLFDTVRLPIYINSESCVPYEYSIVRVSEDEAVRLAFNRLNAELFALVDGADVVSKNIEGVFEEDAYILKCAVVCIKDIAVPLEFEMD